MTKCESLGFRRDELAHNLAEDPLQIFRQTTDTEDRPEQWEL